MSKMPITNEVSITNIDSKLKSTVPMRDDHLKALKSLSQTAQAKVITAPFFPYSGGVFFIQSEDENPRKAVSEFVKHDPYVKNNIVEDYTIKEFAMTDKFKDFERISDDFLLRN